MQDKTAEKPRGVSKNIILEYLNIFMGYCNTVDDNVARQDLTDKIKKLINETHEEIKTMNHKRPTNILSASICYAHQQSIPKDHQLTFDYTTFNMWLRNHVKAISKKQKEQQVLVPYAATQVLDYYVNPGIAKINKEILC